MNGANTLLFLDIGDAGLLLRCVVQGPGRGVHPDVLILPQLGLLLNMFLPVLAPDELRQMAVPQYAPDLTVELVLLLQLLVVRQLLLLSGKQLHHDRAPFQYRLQGIRSIGLPDADVHVVAAGDHVAAVHRVQDRVDLLHPAVVVHLARTALLHPEYPHRLVEGSRHELSSCWSVVDVENSADVVLVDHLGLVELSHVKGVGISVFVSLLGRKDGCTTVKLMGS